MGLPRFSPRSRGTRRRLSRRCRSDRWLPALTGAHAVADGDLQDALGSSRLRRVVVGCGLRLGVPSPTCVLTSRLTRRHHSAFQRLAPLLGSPRALGAVAFRCLAAARHARFFDRFGAYRRRRSVPQLDRRGRPRREQARDLFARDSVQCARKRGRVSVDEASGGQYRLAPVPFAPLLACSPRRARSCVRPPVRASAAGRSASARGRAPASRRRPAGRSVHRPRRGRRRSAPGSRAVPRARVRAAASTPRRPTRSPRRRPALPVLRHHVPLAVLDVLGLEHHDLVEPLSPVPVTARFPPVPSGAGVLSGSFPARVPGAKYGVIRTASEMRASGLPAGLRAGARADRPRAAGRLRARIGSVRRQRRLPVDAQDRRSRPAAASRWFPGAVRLPRLEQAAGGGRPAGGVPQGPERSAERCVPCPTLTFRPALLPAARCAPRRRRGPRGPARSVACRRCPDATPTGRAGAGRRSRRACAR